MTETMKDENVLYFTRLHWIVFFWPIVGFFVPLVSQLYFPQLSDLNLFLLAFDVLWIGMTWVTYYYSSITIKKKQVILRTGIIVRQTVDMPLSKIETIDIRQSILGSVLQYGALVITGTGGTKHLINYIYRPLTCRRYIEQLMNDPQ